MGLGFAVCIYICGDTHERTTPSQPNILPVLKALLTTLHLTRSLTCSLIHLS